jgi:hypothetical protein
VRIYYKTFALPRKSQENRGFSAQTPRSQSDPIMPIIQGVQNISAPINLRIHRAVVHGESKKERRFLVDWW